MKRTVGEILGLLDRLAPASVAEKWDNVGLLLGDPGRETRGAVISLDLNEDSIKLAKRRGYGLIVNHHPCIFPKGKGLDRVVTDPGLGGLRLKALEAGIAVAAYHTNFDRCATEVALRVSDALGLTPKGRLQAAVEPDALSKLAVFVPDSHLERVREAVCGVPGVGQVGDYTQCTFQVGGTGTFRGGKATKPYLGKPGKLERVSEVRLEVVYPTGLQPEVLRALREAHPYDEVAFDLYPVRQDPPLLGIVRGSGYGVWGEFRRSKSFPEVARCVRRVFEIPGFRMTGSTPRKVRRLAFAAGSGDDFIQAGLKLNCDLYITGETHYHSALRASRQGMTVLELGHLESEKFFPLILRGWLEGFGTPAVLVHSPTQKIITPSGGKQ